MDTDVGADSEPFPKTDRDIIFNCPQCTSALVVAAAASGLTVNCEQCTSPIAVPEMTSCANKKTPALETNGRVAELQRCLKENESQRTEITSYINQHSIQLHRWQLRLQMLDERRRELLSQIAALS